MANRPRLLYLARSSPGLDDVLTRIKALGLEVTLAFTSDSAVALCLGNHFAAVVLDAALIRNDDWSVAKSLKLIKPTLPILLLDPRDVTRRDTIPANIDARASCDDPNDVLVKLREIVSQKSQSGRRSGLCPITEWKDDEI